MATSFSNSLASDASDSIFAFDAFNPLFDFAPVSTWFAPPPPVFSAALASPTPVLTPTPVATVSSATTSVTSKTTATVPAWISALKDTALKADFTTFASAGTITEVELAKAMTDLASELTSSKSTLSAGQVTDLKAIASNIVSMGASSYLQFITNAFVNGNAANAAFTGGAAKSTTLGNLAAGYSATQLNELTDKWFLGTDLPGDSVSMSGAKTFTVTYSTVGSPLYGSGGPTMADINQGYLGDCYLLSALAEVADQDPSAIQSMITNNGNGTYGVRFFVNGVARYVTVDSQLADGGKEFNSATNIWASLVEQAYAELQAQGVVTGNSVNYGNSFSTIGNGGAPEYTLEEITGASAITDFDAGKSSWNSYVFNSSLSVTSSKASLTTASILSTLAADLLVGDDIDLCSETNATDSKGKTTLVADHAMSVYGYDATTGLLEIRNPWGTESGQSWDTTFEISLSTLLTAGNVLTADNVGTATTIAGASVVAASALQTLSQVTSFSVSDSVADVVSGLSSLVADAKLSALTVTGTTSADTLNLSSFKGTATINLGGDSDAAALSGFSATSSGIGKATSLNLGTGAYDLLTLGAGAETIDATLGAAGGVLSISGFSSAHDLLSIALNGATLEQTLVNGGDWLSSSSDLTHGVFLAGVTTVQKVTTAAGLASVA